jgi:hypothetical protein
MNFDDCNLDDSSDSDHHDGVPLRRTLEDVKSDLLLRLVHVREDLKKKERAKRKKQREERMLKRVTEKIAKKAIRQEIAELAKQCKCGNNRKHCRTCLRERYEEDPVYFVGNRLVKDAKRRCLQKNVLMEIDTNWVRKCFKHQQGLCALCGQLMTVFDPRFDDAIRNKLTFMRFPSNISIDQRVPAEGYTENNAQLVHLRCNIAKLDMSQEEFISMCKSVSLFHAKKESDNGEDKTTAAWFNKFN